MRPLLQIFIIKTLFSYYCTHVLFSALLKGWAMKLLVCSANSLYRKFEGFQGFFSFFLWAIFFPEVLRVSSIGQRVVKLLLAQTILALASRETTLEEINLWLARNIYHGTLPVMLFTNLPVISYHFTWNFPWGVTILTVWCKLSEG